MWLGSAYARTRLSASSASSLTGPSLGLFKAARLFARTPFGYSTRHSAKVVGFEVGEGKSEGSASLRNVQGAKHAMDCRSAYWDSNSVYKRRNPVNGRSGLSSNCNQLLQLWKYSFHKCDPSGRSYPYWRWKIKGNGIKKRGFKWISLLSQKPAESGWIQVLEVWSIMLSAGGM